MRNEFQSHQDQSGPEQDARARSEPESGFCGGIREYRVRGSSVRRTFAWLGREGITREAQYQGIMGSSSGVTALWVHGTGGVLDPRSYVAAY